MSDRWVPRRDSKWSSERERARRGQRPSRTTEGGEPSSSFVPRRPAHPEPPAETEPEQTPSTERIDRLMSGERGRAPLGPRRPEPPGGDGGDEPPGGGLPDLPGGRPDNTRLVILGGLLFLAMALIFVLPRLLDDGGGGDTTPTPEMIQTPTPPSNQGDLAIPTQSLADAEHIVCIDAGHGGWDPGRTREANSRAPAIEESDINLAMSWMLKERLEQEGIAVVMTRPSGLATNIFNEDINGDGQTLQDSEQAGFLDEFQARINICNEAGADLLISMHLNGVADPSARGFEVLYTRAPFRPFGDRNADFANFVYREINAAYTEAGFDTTPRGAIPDDELDAAPHDSGAQRHLIIIGPEISNADFTIEPSQMPGSVIEPVFITNDDDAAFIARPENQLLLVDAYADGILQYFNKYPEAP